MTEPGSTAAFIVSAPLAALQQKCAQESEVFVKSPPDYLYHYTRIEALKLIVDSKALWASDIAYMNDASEMTYSGQLVRRCIDGVASLDDDELKLLDWIQRSCDFRDVYRVFCVSFSEEKDDLSQWRAYGGPCGVAVGFSTVSWQRIDSDFSLVNVIYDVEGQRRAFTNIVNVALECYRNYSSSTGLKDDAFKSGICGVIRTSLMNCMLRFKHPAFRHEKEWRLVKTADKLNLEEIGLCHRPSSLGFTPYLELRPYAMAGTQAGRLPIQSVQIGPSPHQDLVHKATLEFMHLEGYRPLVVQRSSAPLR